MPVDTGASWWRTIKIDRLRANAGWACPMRLSRKHGYASRRPWRKVRRPASSNPGWHGQAEPAAAAAGRERRARWAAAQDRSAVAQAVAAGAARAEAFSRRRPGVSGRPRRQALETAIRMAHGSVSRPIRAGRWSAPRRAPGSGGEHACQGSGAAAVIASGVRLRLAIPSVSAVEPTCRRPSL